MALLLGVELDVCESFMISRYPLQFGEKDNCTECPAKCSTDNRTRDDTSSRIQSQIKNTIFSDVASFLKNWL